MREKFSKREREAAAMYCALMASATKAQWPLPEIAQACADASWRAISLATSAVCFVTSLSIYPLISREIDAEAESLIRCGWSPGDR
jgi:hypothetical protein